jgi:hypothetical protein
MPSAVMRIYSTNMQSLSLFSKAPCRANIYLLAYDSHMAAGISYNGHGARSALRKLAAYGWASTTHAAILLFDNVQQGV